MKEGKNALPVVVSQLVDAIALPKEVIIRAMNLASKVISPGAEELGIHFAESIRKRRLINQMEILSDAEEKIRYIGKDPRQLNLKTLTPLLDGIGLEEDISLKERWAKLIANIVTNDENGLEPRLVKTLSNITALEAKVLDEVYKEFKIGQIRIHKNLIKYNPKRVSSPDNIPVDHVYIKRIEISRSINLTELSENIAFEALLQLGLIRYAEPDVNIDASSSSGTVREDYDDIDLDLDVSAEVSASENLYLTEYGRYFVKSCTQI